MKLINATISLLNDGKTYLNKISPVLYNRPISLLSNVSIGQHTRHFIEFYQCLLEQWLLESVNYDLRKRDRRIEEDPVFALQTITQILKQLEGLSLDNPLTLCASIGGGIAVRTNVGRELLYNLEHTIHHFAIIKIGLNIVAPEIELPAGFGVAPSTVEFRKQLTSG